MQTNYKFRTIDEIIKGLLENQDPLGYGKIKTYLSRYEIYSLAIQIQKNEILQSGLLGTRNDEHPAFIENISIAIKESM